ncbi:WbuC family cupin fold metalloprotein [Alteromonas sp. ALT199]|uniref:WbuC family cupin fold metalloprotein n=1 Tax=unclassified Alteromonas TaxID=2614992 RepID=UPI001BED0055|nr:WbuC family cupin fold metalloprotein [Alteromonas sp. ALT199]MBT3135678.1 WbuC family cupin fold metalloprotein [Alteromonas sp. ALT199]
MDNTKYFDKALFSELKQKAAESARRRANFNVHKSYADMVQRLFIAMMPDSYVRPHQHVQPHKWEFFMVVEGELDILFFDDEGLVKNKVTLTANGATSGIEIPPNTWHATVCHRPVVFMEVKQGPYEVTDDKGFASWSPQEGSDLVPRFLAMLKRAEVGSEVNCLNSSLS